MNYLVDANVVSEAVRKSPDVRVLDWLATHDGDLYISAITLGEIEKGIIQLPGGSRKQRLENWLEEVRAALAGRILVFGEIEATAWARYFEAQRSQGRLRPSIDSMIAATATVHGLTVATRNTQDFPGVDVTNPWIDQ